MSKCQSVNEKITKRRKMSNKKFLVLWTESKETSIVKKKDIKKRKDNDGKEIVQAWWNKDLYDVKILAEDEDEEFLSSLPISTDGKIMKTRSKITLTAAEKKEKNKRDKQLKKSRQEVENETYNQILNNKSIFESEDEESDHENFEKSTDIIGDDVEDEYTKNEVLESFSNRNETCTVKNSKYQKKTQINCTNSTDEVIEIVAEPEENAENDKILEKAESFAVSSEKKRKNKPSLSENLICHFCVPFSANSSVLEQIKALTKSFTVHLEQLTDDISQPDEVKLSPIYDIKMNRFKLANFVRFCKGNRKDLARDLLKELIGTEKLATMSASKIPQDILFSVENYINSDVLRSPKITLSEYKRAITLYCGSLKVKTPDSQKKKKNNVLNSIQKSSQKSNISNGSTGNLNRKSRSLSRNRKERSEDESLVTEKYRQRSFSQKRSSSSERRSREKSSSRRCSREKSLTRQRSSSGCRSREKSLSGHRSSRERRSREKSSSRHCSREKSLTRQRSSSGCRSREKSSSERRSRKKSLSRKRSRSRKKSSSGRRSREKSLTRKRSLSKDKDRGKKRSQSRNSRGKKSSKRRHSRSPDKTDDKHRQKRKKKNKHNSKQRSRSRSRSRSRKSPKNERQETRT